MLAQSAQKGMENRERNGVTESGMSQERQEGFSRRLWRLMIRLVCFMEYSAKVDASAIAGELGTR